MSVERPLSIPVERTDSEGGIAQGEPALRRALQELSEGLGTAAEKRVHFKVFRVQPSQEFPDQIVTRAYYEASGHTGDETRQQNAIWVARWAQSTQGEPPRLERLDVEQYEQSQLRGGDGRLLADCTASVLGESPIFAGQLAYGHTYWMRRLQSHLGIDVAGHHGLAVGDINGDGLDDVYVCQPGGLPNAMLVHQLPQPVFQLTPKMKLQK